MKKTKQEQTQEKLVEEKTSTSLSKPVKFKNKFNLFIKFKKNKAEEIEKTPEELALEAKQEAESKKQVEEVGQVVANQKSKKKKILNAIFFVLNIVVVVLILVFQVLQNGFMPISNLAINWGFVFLIFAVFALIMIGESARINHLVKKSGKSKPILSYKTAVLGRYWDSITPMSTGGQPFQVFYLSSHGVKATNAISIPINKYLFQQIAWLIFSLICVIIGSSIGGIGGNTGSNVVGGAAIVGFCLNFLLILLVVVLSTSKTIGKKIVVNVLKLLQKMHIVKNYEDRYNQVMKMVTDYQAIMKGYAKNIGSLLYMIFMSFLHLFLNYSLPYLVYCVFAGWNPTLWGQMLVMGALIDLAAGFIPLPGGTGVSELSFTALFAAFFVDGTLFWALLLWRLMTYYLYIIQGLLLMIYDYAYGNKKFQWTRKRESLEEESTVFKQKQIEKFRSERNKRRKKML